MVPSMAVALQELGTSGCPRPLLPLSALSSTSLGFVAFPSARMKPWYLQTKMWTAALCGQAEHLCRMVISARGLREPGARPKHPESRTGGSHRNRLGYVQTCFPLQANVC